MYVYIHTYMYQNQSNENPSTMSNQMLFTFKFQLAYLLDKFQEFLRLHVWKDTAKIHVCCKM